MYLYIGNKNIIKKTEIIGIFTLKYIKNTKDFKNLKQRLIDKDDYIKYSEGNEKTFILCEKDGKDKGVVSKTNPWTIIKNFNKI